MTTVELQNAVFIQDQQIKTDSLKVAEVLNRTDLTQILPHSKQPYPKYVEHNVAVQSKLERKTLRCWIFKSTQPTMIDVGH
ncbi:hypothetical protein [Acinetobacter colistiniresistens]|uniref:hypothetical protein n=1 Tax=Acinetobacter colistiniresistens TaxID=280145 RepID=UPI002FE2B750